jgi:VanZ family protein
MGLLFYRAYQTLSFKNNRQLLLVLSMASASLYGISDEIHQHFVPYREADFFDAVADILGAICGVYVYQFWRLRKKN